MNLPTAREEVLAFMQALEEEPHHVQHVAALALQLFDELEELHGLGDHDRFILEAAALLHDIGWSVSPDGSGHHRESARLIREHGWKHFDEQAVTLTAVVARYHRKSPLAPAERRRVQQLAALLRLADGLDRSHQQYVSGVSVEIQPDTLLLRLHTSHPCSREVASALKKSDLAATIFHRPVTLAVVLEGKT